MTISPFFPASEPARSAPCGPESARRARDRRPPAIFGAMLLRALEVLALWQARQRERRYLLMLDDASLKDIGVSRSEAEREAGKAFWQP